MDRFQKAKEERMLLAMRLKEKHLAGMSDEYAQVVFDKAWDYGHANGESEVEVFYVELAKMAIDTTDIFIKQVRKNLLGE